MDSERKDRMADTTPLRNKDDFGGVLVLSFFGLVMRLC